MFFTHSGHDPCCALRLYTPYQLALLINGCTIPVCEGSLISTIQIIVGFINIAPIRSMDAGLDFIPKPLDAVRANTFELYRLPIFIHQFSSLPKVVHNVPQGSSR